MPVRGIQKNVRGGDEFISGQLSYWEQHSDGFRGLTATTTTITVTTRSKVVPGQNSRENEGHKGKHWHMEYLFH